MVKQTILKLLASSSFVTYNKDIAIAVGVEEAIMLGEIASEYDYWLNHNGITPDGYFYSTIQNVSEKTGLSEHKQREAVKKLQSLGLLDCKQKGIPSKRHFKLNEEVIVRYLQTLVLENSRPCTGKTQELVPENFKTNNNINNNNIINNNLYCGETSSPDVSTQPTDIFSEQYHSVNKKPTPTPPPVEKFTEEIKQIVDYLNEKAHTRYRANSDSTKRLIVAKLNQKYTVDDFKHVIDVKCAEWLNNDMAKFLRPETLFGNKFEGYLNSNIFVDPGKVSAHLSGKKADKSQIMDEAF